MYPLPPFLSRGADRVNYLCNNDFNRETNEAGPKHLLGMDYAGSSTDFQDTEE